MNILLTGGTGYIGSHTAIELIQSGHHVVLLDNLYNSKVTVLDKIAQIAGQKPDFYEVDLLDQDKLNQVFAAEEQKGHKIDLVIHFAGLKAVGESVKQPLKYYENNIGGTINLLKVMQKYNVHKIIFSSSATVYGEQSTPEWVETMTTGIGIPSPYGETKHIIEKMLEHQTIADPNFQVINLRYFNPIGNHPSGLIGEDPNGIPNNLMPIIMKVALGKMPELQIYGNDYPTPDGTCRRDYIHVVDLAKGHVAAIAALGPGVKVYNLGANHSTSVLEMIAAFNHAAAEDDWAAKHLICPLPTAVASRRLGDFPEFYANADKAARDLNWHTELTIADAMRDTIEFLKNN